MINKTFLSLILALLFTAMCLQAFVVFTNLPLKSSTGNLRNLNYTAGNDLNAEHDLFALNKPPAMLTVNDTTVNHSSMINTEAPNSPKPYTSGDEINAESLPTIFISGLVKDYHGTPLAGVLVKSDGKPAGAHTDSQGRYQLLIEHRENHYPTLVFLKSGYKKKMARIVEPDLDLRNAVAVNMQMEYSSETLNVYGWLGETNGANIEGEVIKLTSLREALHYSALSDADGNFIFEGVRRGVDYKINIKPSQMYQSIALDNLTITQQSSPLFITLKPVRLMNFEGTVVDRYGGPVRKLKFTIRSGLNSTYDTDLVTDELGRFVAKDYPMGPLSFTTQAPLFFKVAGIDLSQSMATDIIIPVDVGPHQIIGWVFDQNGLPLPGARAMLDAEFNYNSLNSTSIRTFVTDEEGYFEFSSLGPGEHYVTIYAKGFINQGSSYDTSVQFDPLHLQLSPGPESLISSESLKLKQFETSNQVETMVY